jgi:hypothetical protein
MKGIQFDSLAVTTDLINCPSFALKYLTSLGPQTVMILFIQAM